VGTASWEHPERDLDDEPVGSDTTGSVMSADRPANDAMRSWLARGIHTFGIDSRRLGGRGHARRVLGEDRRSASRAAGAWRELASALQRHTLHSALTRLSAAERQIVTLAYLEGRTNRQIAASLGVSVSTVSRRLWIALEHLDEHVHRTGTWVTSMLLLGVVYVIDRSGRLGRFAGTAASADWPHKLAGTVVVSTVAVASVGLVAVNLHPTTAKHAPSPATAGLIKSVPGATRSFLPGVQPFASITTAPITPSSAAPIVKSTATRPSGTSTATKATKADSDTADEDSEQGDDSSEQSDGDDKHDSDHSGQEPIKSHPRGLRVQQGDAH
jgi:hypothetical protein